MKKSVSKSDTKVKAIPQPKVSAQERQWRIQDDARALKTAAEIQNDKRRFLDAQKQLKVEQQAIQKAIKK